jgi:hypothetical protein
VPDTPGGIKELDVAIKALDQVTLILTGVPGLISLGESIVQMFINNGMTKEEAQAAVERYKAAVVGAKAFNTSWLAEHPRV